MALDKVDPIVREALKRDGWTVEKKPLVLIEGKDKVEIDIQAEKVIAATKDKERIVVEVKTFGKRSVIYSFHEALGQYFNYLTALDIMNEERVLFLAVDAEIYDKMLDNVFIKASLERYKVKTLIFDVTEKTIIKWIR